MKIIDEAMQLHNFIVKYWLEHPEEFGYEAKQQEIEDYEAESDIVSLK